MDQSWLRKEERRKKNSRSRNGKQIDGVDQAIQINESGSTNDKNDQENGSLIHEFPQKIQSL